MPSEETADTGWVGPFDGIRQFPENVANLLFDSSEGRRKVNWTDRLCLIVVFFLVALDGIIYVFSDDESPRGWITPETKRVIRALLGLVLPLVILALFVWVVFNVDFHPYP